MSHTRVGFIGVGDQGAPIARRILEGDFPLAVYARRAASLEPFRDTRATFPESVAALGAQSDVVGICVVDDAGVEEVVVASGLLEAMAPGSAIAVHSTIHPETCRRLAARASDRGIALLDAPVSGMAEAARAGSMIIMVGGDREAFDRCLPVFETFGAAVHLGPVGSGQVAKLINNLVGGCNLAVAHDALERGRQLGLDRAALARVIRAGSGASWGLGVYADSQFSLGLGRERGIELVARNGRKDIELALGLLASSGLDAGILAPAAEAFLAAVDREASSQAGAGPATTPRRALTTGA